VRGDYSFREGGKSDNAASLHHALTYPQRGCLLGGLLNRPETRLLWGRTAGRSGAVLLEAINANVHPLWVPS